MSNNFPLQPSVVKSIGLSPWRAIGIAERYWPAFVESYRQSGSLVTAWKRLEEVVSRDQPLHAYAPVVRDLLCVWLLGTLDPQPIEPDLSAVRTVTIPLDGPTVKLIDRMRGPMSRDCYVRAAVFQFAYAAEQSRSEIRLAPAQSTPCPAPQPREEVPCPSSA